MIRLLVLLTVLLGSIGFTNIASMAEISPSRDRSSYRIVNLVNDFQAYYRQCSTKEWDYRLSNWDSMASGLECAKSPTRSHHG